MGEDSCPQVIACLEMVHHNKNPVSIPVSHAITLPPDSASLLEIAHAPMEAMQNLSLSVLPCVAQMEAPATPPATLPALNIPPALPKSNQHGDLEFESK